MLVARHIFSDCLGHRIGEAGGQIAVRGADRLPLQQIGQISTSLTTI